MPCYCFCHLCHCWLCSYERFSPSLWVIYSCFFGCLVISHCKFYIISAGLLCSFNILELCSHLGGKLLRNPLSFSRLDLTFVSHPDCRAVTRGRAAQCDAPRVTRFLLSLRGSLCSGSGPPAPPGHRSSRALLPHTGSSAEDTGDPRGPPALSLGLSPLCCSRLSPAP